MPTLDQPQEQPPPAKGSAQAVVPMKRASKTTSSWPDRLFSKLCLVMAFTVVALIGWIGIQLFAESRLTQAKFGLKFLTGTEWDSVHHSYGALPFLVGTIITSVIALCLSVPLAVMAAVYLSEYAPRWAANILSFFIELIAAVPSIIFGLWGFVVLCPILQAHFYPVLVKNFGWIPLFGGPTVGTSVLAAGIVLAIMVMPFICSVSYSVLKAVPSGQRFAALGLGATKWEATKNVVVPEAKSGIAGGVMLGLGRAIGETMAVVMVIGSDINMHASILKAGYTMPALLANQFSEAFNVPEQRSALLEIGLLLFVITMAVNILARGLLVVSQKKIKESRRGRRYKDLALKDEHMNFGTFFGIGLALVIGYSIGQAVLPNHTTSALIARLAIAGITVFLAIKAKAFTEKPSSIEPWRNLKASFMKAVLATCATFGVFILFALMIYLIQKGIPGLNSDLFTKLPTDPTDIHSGIKNAIVGTLVLMVIASLIGIPVGLLGGVWVSEYGKGRVRGFIRFCSEVLSGIPSVVVGLFAYGAFVLPFGFSAWSGGVALAVMMIPTVIRTSEEMMRLIPKEIREASLGLGASRFQTILYVVIPAARNGIITGVILAIARVAGETAPLLFTAFGNPGMSTSPTKPIESLTLIIYQYATSPYDVWVKQAWAGSLVLMLMILIISLLAKFATRTKYRTT